MTDPGPGRPPKYGERKKVASIRITPTLRRYFDDQAASMSDLIEDTFRKTKEFRTWLRTFKR